MISNPPDNDGSGVVPTASFVARTSASPPCGGPTGFTKFVSTPAAVRSGIVVVVVVVVELWVGGADWPEAGELDANVNRTAHAATA